MRVLIADDHGLYRAGLRNLVSQLLPGSQVQEASTLKQALAALPDGYMLALFDLNMPGERTLAHMPALRTLYPELKIAIVSGSNAREDVAEALSVGVHGFIHKSQADEEVANALRDILDGRVFVPHSLSTLTLVDSHAPGHADRFDSDLSHLTERQRDVLKCLARGLTNKEIARVLLIAEPTVKIHVSALMRVLSVRNRTEAAVVARQVLD